MMSESVNMTEWGDDPWPEGYRLKELWEANYGPGRVPSWIEPYLDAEEFAEINPPVLLLPMPPGGMSGPYAP